MKRLAFILAVSVVLTARAASAQEAPWNVSSTLPAARPVAVEQSLAVARRDASSPTLPERGRVNLTLVGALMLGTSYGLTAGLTLGTASDLGALSPPQVWLLVPVIGPFGALGSILSVSCGTGLVGFSCGVSKFFFGSLFAVDGIAQVAGLGVMIAGLARSEPAASPSAPTPAPRRLPWWVLAPGAPGAPLGLTFTARHF